MVTRLKFRKESVVGIVDYAKLRKHTTNFCCYMNLFLSKKVIVKLTNIQRKV